MVPFAIEYLKSVAATAPALRYVPNPGNLGDALIAAATYLALREAGVPFSIGLRDASPDDAFVLAGGGNLVPMYQDTARALTWLRDHARGPVVLLPHTVDGHEALLASLDGRFSLFAREPVSFDYLQRVCPDAKVGIDHDLAFSLDVDRLHAQVEAALAQAAPATLALRERIFRASLMHHAMTGGRARLLRHDAERAPSSFASHGPVLDLSALADSAWGHEAQCLAVADAVLLALASFADVTTDRLHLTIGRALMGLPVTMSGNSYWKNRAVFEFSLQPHFESVRWAEPAAPARAAAEPATAEALCA